MDLLRNRRGFLFTISAIILIVPLIYLISFYGEVSEPQMRDTTGKIRCDELHYYVEDVRKDIERAVSISGRRATIYVIDNIITNEAPLKDYTFTCTPQCDIDCSSQRYPVNGSQAAIAEMVLCGTLYGANISYMQNHTLPGWIRRIEEEGQFIKFDADISIFEVRVIPMDAWHFSVEIDNKIRVSDQRGLCFYSENIMTARSNTSIIGLLDPLYPLKTQGALLKDIQRCKNLELPKTKAGCGTNGSGAGGGFALLYTDPGLDTLLTYNRYCNGSSTAVPSTGDVQDQVFVLNDYLVNQCTPGMKNCFNASMPRHFKAFIAYEPLQPENMTQCSITIPHVVGTGDLDSVLPEMDPPSIECNESKIEDDDCLLVLNVPPPCSLSPLHYVLIGCNNSNLNKSCYYVSDIEEHPGMNCTNENHSNGPCFFDRLDGNLNLSQRYVKQAKETFNTTSIGIESFVDIYILYGLKNLEYDVIVNSTYSWVDYLYWQNITGCDVGGYCEKSNYSFKLDCPHAYGYGMDTACKYVAECPVCGDVFCDSLETCISCLQECDCPNCPVFAEMTACKNAPCGPVNCNITFNLHILDQTGQLMNLSEEPIINISGENAPAPPWSFTDRMHKNTGETGGYHYDLTIDKQMEINGSIAVREGGCPLLRNVTEHRKAGSLTSCS